MLFTQQERTDLPLAPGRPELFSHLQTATDVTLYDLPMQNIERAIRLDDATRHLSRVLEPEEANETYGIEGHVKFDKPIHRAKAELINKYKREELERMTLLELGNDTLFREAAFFGTSVVAQGLDPINLAFMFVPIVGEAKYAKLVAKHGLTKARLIAGAAEGLIGGALVEPMSYLSKAVGEQNIYGMTDTLTNLGAGTLFGAGLRVGGGAFADAAKPIIASLAEGTGSKRVLSKMHKTFAVEADRAANDAGYSKGTGSYNEYVAKHITTNLEMHNAEIRMIQQEIAMKDPRILRKAFEEGINNILNDEVFVGPNLILQVNEVNTVVSRMHDNWAMSLDDIIADVKVKHGGDLAVDETTIRLNKTEMAISTTDTAKHIRTINNAKPEDFQVLVYNEARAALKERKTLFVDGVELSTEALEVMTEGMDAMKRTPTEVANDGRSKKPVELEKIEASPDHVDLSTPELASESRKITADEINAQADEIIRALKERGGAKTTEDMAMATAELESYIGHLPDDIKNDIINDFEAPLRLEDEIAGYFAGIRCMVENLG